MPIDFNLWSLMLMRWLNPVAARGAANDDGRAAASDDHHGVGRWRNRPPPLDLARLSPHLRRDMGLD